MTDPGARWVRVRREGLSTPSIASDAAGKGSRVALLDTGVHFAHPHLAAGGESWAVVRVEGRLQVVADDTGDRIGHGTCCAALLRLLAPEADIISFRVTDHRPTTDSERLAFAIRAATEAGCSIAVVPIGTRRGDPARFRTVVDDALARGTLVVASDPTPWTDPGTAEVRSGRGSRTDGPEPSSALEPTSQSTLPARAPGVLAVRHRDGVDVVSEAGAYWAEGRARPALGHPTNFWGPSLAAARGAAATARLAELTGCRGKALLDALSKALGV